MIDLYDVKTRVYRYGWFDGVYDEVKMCWHCKTRDQSLISKDMIQQYFDAPPTDAIEILDQSFLKEEALQLKAYLDKYFQSMPEIKGARTEIILCPLPFRNDLGVGVPTSGGGSHYIDLSWNDDYSLPFGVWGGFNTHDSIRIERKEIMQEMIEEIKSGCIERYDAFVVKHDSKNLRFDENGQYIGEYTFGRRNYVFPSIMNPLVILRHPLLTKEKLLALLSRSIATLAQTNDLKDIQDAERIPHVLIPDLNKFAKDGKLFTV